ncbi:HlyD family efflux transporter periplasmic adaptor subunit [Paracoccus sp. S3-43]|uniref:HlyD family efflux transporter periplasmic adaptor subunit n=1 Tax=Paracoccus sp. S3-43 TaxID=3030011 RepID=UPI0023AF7310|nr:HlyD family efflux transporter periplasmic adaptor subunit [Paracoccus sp. S3-43]WEF25815.1 HlyD family efflux transporter periplasmic adaptor subunit [Paracoccus sp. S3-43]
MSDKDAPLSPDPVPLFRKQAVAYQSRSLDGEVLVSLSMRMRVLIVLATVVVCGAVIFAATASYARIETVVGWVVPEGGLIRVTAPQGGVIQTLSVSEGDEVRVGQSLAQLRLSADLEDGSAGQALQLQLSAQIEAVRAQAEAEREKLLAEEASLETQRAALLRELEQGRSRIETMTRHLQLVQSNAERVRTVAGRGFASTKSVEESEMSVLSAQQELSNVRSSVMSIERQISDIDAQLRSLPISIRAAEAAASASQAQLAQQGTEMATQNVYHAGATVAGRVVAVPVSRGQTVAPQSVVAVVTPEGSTLQAELYVPSRSAGFIQKGQEVQLMYQAFPYQKFGTAPGVVHSVSRTVLAPAEVAIPGLDISEPVFRVKVQMESDQIRAYGQGIQIQPGMLLTAGIVIDRRTLVEWLLDPIYAVGRLG